jgi:hypothetical protein
MKTVLNNITVLAIREAAQGGLKAKGNVLFNYQRHLISAYYCSTE